jgi:hypothetical protein
MFSFEKDVCSNGIKLNSPSNSVPPGAIAENGFEIFDY